MLISKRTSHQPRHQVTVMKTSTSPRCGGLKTSIKYKTFNQNYWDLELMPSLTDSKARIFNWSLLKSSMLFDTRAVFAVGLLSVMCGYLLSAVRNSSMTEHKTDTARRVLIQRNANKLSAEIRPIIDCSQITVSKSLTSLCAKWRIKIVSLNYITKLNIK